MTKKTPFYDGLEKEGQVLLTRTCRQSIEKALKRPPELGERVFKGIILDTETTGLNVESDSLIEIGIREFFFDDQYRFLGIGDCYNQLQDPERPISEEVSKITGIKNEDVKGKAIHWEKVNALVEDCQVIVAHNAAFDFKIMNRVPQFSNKVFLWCCSLTQIPWNELGFLSRSQEVLAILHGFYYDSHRALMDVDALALILSKGSYLKTLLENAKKPIVRIKAKKADFESKDLLRAKGYKWNPNERHWWQDVQADKLDEMKAWLREDVYIKNAFNACQFEEISLYDRFR